MKRIYILMIAICMLNIANAQQKSHQIPNLGREAINNPLHDNFPNHANLKQKSTKAIFWNYDTIVTFDANNNLFQRKTKTFNNNGNVLTFLFESLQNNTWVNSSRYTYTYDANGNMLTQLSENWQNNTWVNASKYTYTYNANGNDLTRLFELWQNNAWVNSSKTTKTFDANGNRLTELDEIWQNNTWVNENKSTSTYDANGNVLTKLYESWQNNAWANTGKSTYTYDANGNKLTELNEQWQNNAWIINYKSTYTYDANGNMLTYLYELWQNNAWVNSSKNTYTYNANGNSITGKYEEWINNTWVLSLGALDVYSSKNKIYKVSNSIRYEAHFVSFTTGINENKNKPINFYPNPVTSKLTINLQQLTKLQNTTVSIYDIQGKLLLQQSITEAQTELNIAAFSKGIYIVKVNNDNNCMQSKFVKE